MALFFINVESGVVATQRQLIAAELATNNTPPERPWHQIRADRDANTLWHAVMRKQDHGIWLGTLIFRHSDHHTSLLNEGWQEVPVAEIEAFGPAASSDGSTESAAASQSDDVDPGDIKKLFG